MDFEKLFLYKQWSDQRLFKAIAQIDQVQYLDDYNFAKQQFNHMVIVEELFRSRLENTEPLHTQTNTDLLPSLDMLEKRIQISNQWFIDFSKHLHVEQLSQVLHFQFIDQKMGSLSVEEILFHMINHGTYHRGNIAHALHHAKVVHPADTYTVFIHQYEPERRLSESPLF
ncbi:damage-inducible protein DinB [Acinetobacter sp. ANC 4558]|uniref:DinB family protein n=1 Tax=Acinetobacter sp. ANC 4558 TaxID=1977876 RepID=UPI000A331585|nr:DinB family protein [Acinetobacter sp. ANC 4558]OTG85877.1 damage-inducible protein DinB [Acinetobacter sp. ANC 4558]